MKSNCKNLQIENEKLLLENKTFSEVAEQNSKLQSLLKRTEHALEDKTNKV